MCIFCTAIPAAAALGAAAHGKQVEARRRSNEDPREPAADRPARLKTLQQLPVAGITGLVLAGLVVGSVVTHIAQPTG